VQRRHLKTSFDQNSSRSPSRLQECSAPNRTNQARRGAVTLWIILAGPAFLALVIFVLEVANIWLARVELENALGATALAAVKEWGDAGVGFGGDTLCPRDVGVAYAAANTLVGVPLSITNNYLQGPPNENASCDGNLIFGAIITQEPPFVFDASVIPGCNAGRVVFDVTAQGDLDTGNHREWGISFQPTNNLASNIRIRRVVYILPEICQTLQGNIPKVFAMQFEEGSPTMSDSVTDCDANNFLTDTCPSGGGTSSQANVYGIDPNSVTIYYDVDLNQDPCAIGNGRVIDETNTEISRTMAIEFPDDPNNLLLGFDLEDRIRFGANVRDTISNEQIGADLIGSCAVEVIICFNDGTSMMGTFVDNNELSNECLQCVSVASWGSNTPLNIIDCNANPTTAGNHGLIIHPLGIPDIPCPSGASANNNGQSLVAFNLNGGGGGDPYAVQAQATVQVKSLFCELCGIPLGPFFVTAKETAFYDCERRCPRLIKINPENFYCPGPAPPLP
jgi:hypothetical protein